MDIDHITLKMPSGNMLMVDSMNQGKNNLINIYIENRIAKTIKQVAMVKQLAASNEHSDMLDVTVFPGQDNDSKETFLVVSQMNKGEDHETRHYIDGNSSKDSD